GEYQHHNDCCDQHSDCVSACDVAPDCPHQDGNCDYPGRDDEHQRLTEERGSLIDQALDGKWPEMTSATFDGSTQAVNRDQDEHICCDQNQEPRDVFGRH